MPKHWLFRQRQLVRGKCGGEPMLGVSAEIGERNSWIVAGRGAPVAQNRSVDRWRGGDRSAVMGEDGVDRVSNGGAPARHRRDWQRPGYEILEFRRCEKCERGSHVADERRMLVPPRLEAGIGLAE